MGADIYLKSVFDPHHDACEKAFNEAIAIRDAIDQTKHPEAARMAQERVHDAYNNMYAKGYFRDSYNPSALFWAIGLSWWNDVGPRLNNDGELDQNGLKWLQQELQNRPVTKKLVHNHVKNKNAEYKEKGYGKPFTESASELVDYFQQCHKELADLVDLAISRNENLRCSI